MGNNICGLDEDKKQALHQESKTMLTKIVDDVVIHIIQAEIVEEVTDVIVNASHEPNDSYIQRRYSNFYIYLQEIETIKLEINQSIVYINLHLLVKIGDIVISEAENVNSLEIYHVKLPLYQDPRDLHKLYTSYLQCLHQKGHKIISFTEQSTPNFAVPRQYNAEVLIRAIFQSISDGIEFEQIKFVSLDQLTLKYFAYELLKQLDQQKIPDLNTLRVQSFMQFITTFEETKQEVYLLSTGITDLEKNEEQQ